MTRMIFVNLPVTDLARATAFYQAIGFTKNDMFSNEQASGMVWSDAIHVMLLDHAFYATFTDKRIIDGRTQSGVLLCLTFDSRAAVMAALPNVKVSAESVRNPALSMAISPDGLQLALGKYKTLEISSSATIDKTQKIVVEDGKVNDVEFSADGQRVLLATGVTGLSGRGVVVDIAKLYIVQEFAGHNDVAYAAVWSPDEQLVATAGYDRRIILHNAVTGELVRVLNGHNGAVFHLQFSPDGTLLASASADGTVKVWHVATGERLDTLSQPQAEQYSVRFSPDGNSIYATGADNRIRKWNVVFVLFKIIVKPKGGIYTLVS